MIRKIILRNKNRKKSGFSLIDILLSMFIVLAIISIFLTAAGTAKFSRNSALQSLATSIASRDLENQRNLAFSDISSGAITDPESNRLPSYNGQRTVVTYDGNSKIKQVSELITWVEKTATRQIRLETLISENGL